ncbi:MAG TPA: hypothetical protein PL187_07875, partial [Caldilinea sp.]|nr:hypothetical protein [Caldilinea sp.]
MPPTRHLSLTLRFEIRCTGGDQYRVELHDGSAGGLTHDAVTITAAEVRKWRERGRVDPDAVGAALAARIFTPKISSFFLERRGGAISRRVRVELCIHDADNPLHGLPWELMYGPAIDATPLPLAADEATPFTRFDALQATLAPPLPRRPLRLLVVVANPWE